MKKYLLLLLLNVSFLNSQITNLHSFLSNGNGGGSPGGYASLTYLNDKLYGIAEYGAENNNIPYIYSVNTDGSGYTILYSFGAGYGSGIGSLLFSNNIFYGMTSNEIYKINIDGSGFTILHNFSYNNANDGADAHGSLIISGNILYGMTRKGGATVDVNNQNSGYGTIFKINTDGTNFNLLHSFVIGEDYPYGSLLLDGNFLYGMSSAFGTTTIGGKIFKINIDGSGYSILHSFSGADGSSPNGNLIISGNTLYGMTPWGGNYNGSVRKGNVFKINTDGTGFQSIFNDLNGSTYHTWSYGSLVQVGNVLYGKSDVNLYSLNTDGSNYQWYNNGVGYCPFAYNPFENGNLVYGNGALYGVNNDCGGAYGVGLIYKFVPANLGVNVYDKTDKVVVYPNPANDRITIDCGNLANVAGWKIEIVNTLGQEIFNDVIDKQQFVVSINAFCVQGVCFVKIYDDSNNLVCTKKVILQ